MEASKKEILTNAGVDVDTAMERFMGNEALFMRFLKKFTSDPNYGVLKKTMDEKQFEEAFKAAHTFKGLCGNLSLSNLFEVVGKQVECLRGGMYAEAEELMPQVEEEYEKIVKVLNTLE